VLGRIPIKVHNLGSSEGRKLSFARETLYKRMSASLMSLAVNIPVYLVNTKQMDYLCPPGGRRFFSKEKLRELFQKLSQDLRERRNDLPKRDDLLDDFLNDPWEPFLQLERDLVYVCVGLYVRGLNSEQKETVLALTAKNPNPKAKSAFLDHKGSAIFLCPERVVEWAKEKGVPTYLVQDMVYYHELGHAFMDTGSSPDSHNEGWGRVVEESLANLVAWQCFRGSEAANVARLIQDEPYEYHGYSAASYHPFPYLGDYRGWLRRRGLGWYQPSYLLLDPARMNILAWKETKRFGLGQDSKAKETVRLWKAFARFLLEEAVIMDRYDGR
jgi:hypothetical protein